MAGRSETFRGAQVRLTGETHGMGWVEVEVIESMDPKLPTKIKVWAKAKHLKKGAVKGY